MQGEGGCAVVGQGHLIETRVLIAVVVSFLMECAVLVVAGCAGVRSEALQQEEQGHTQATKQEQARSPGGASEEARCEGTRTIDLLEGELSVADSSVQPGDPEALFITNDVPGCANGGLLSGTDKPDQLAGEDGEDEVRGLGGSDKLSGGYGSDTIYGGPGGDELQAGGWPP
jgi:RTX calcium-binding nonapeptide repeat (4 copies)